MAPNAITGPVRGFGGGVLVTLGSPVLVVVGAVGAVLVTVGVATVGTVVAALSGPFWIGTTATLPEPPLVNTAPAMPPATMRSANSPMRTYRNFERDFLAFNVVVAASEIRFVRPLTTSFSVFCKLLDLPRLLRDRVATTRALLGNHGPRAAITSLGVWKRSDGFLRNIFTTTSARPGGKVRSMVSSDGGSFI